MGAGLGLRNWGGGGGRWRAGPGRLQREARAWVPGTWRPSDRGGPAVREPRRDSAFPSGRGSPGSLRERAGPQESPGASGPLIGSRREMLNPAAGRFLDRWPRTQSLEGSDRRCRPTSLPRASDGAGSPRPASVPRLRERALSENSWLRGCQLTPQDPRLWRAG